MKVICRIEKLRKIVKRFGSSRQNRVHKDVLWLVSVYSNVMISCFDLRPVSNITGPDSRCRPEFNTWDCEGVARQHCGSCGRRLNLIVGIFINLIVCQQVLVRQNKLTYMAKPHVILTLPRSKQHARDGVQGRVGWCILMGWGWLKTGYTALLALRHHDTSVPRYFGTGTGTELSGDTSGPVPKCLKTVRTIGVL